MHHHGATQNRSTRTHLWQEVYYKLPPSAAVPMRIKAKRDGTDHLELELSPVLLSSLFLGQFRASSFHGLIAAEASKVMRISLVSLAARLVHVHESSGCDTYAWREVKALFVLLVLLIKFFVLQGKKNTRLLAKF